MKTLKRILIAEDSEHDIELMLSVFDSHHLAHEVVVVRDGAEALDYLYQRGAYHDRADGPPIVLFLDLKMPKVDGLEVLQKLKLDPEFKMLPIVMLTSSREEQDLVKSYELGVNSYVVKPVDFQKFIDCIKQLGFYWALCNETLRK